MRRKKRSLIFDGRFRAAWIVSLVLHVSLFAWVSLAPSQPKYRFFGSGTAVNLVGADEIPGGSARGKSGDRPEDVESPARLDGPAEGARKIAAPRKKPAPEKKVEKPAPKKVEKKSVAQKEEPPRKKPAKKSVVRKKAPPKKARRVALKKPPPKKKKVVRRKKRRDPALEARRKRMRERRARAAQWRRKYRKSSKNAPAPGKRKPRAGGPGAERLAKASPRRAPSRGYLGEGGGDGQGGGSRGGGGGGVARTDIERYYGLLAERIGSYWTLPLNLSDVGGMKAEITIDVSRKGGYRKLRIHRSSGNVIYDQAALRAVERAASPSLPRPPDTIREAWLFLGFRFCGKKGVC